MTPETPGIISVCPRLKARRRPSGDHAARPPAAILVSPLPSAFATYTYSTCGGGPGGKFGGEGGLGFAGAVTTVGGPVGGESDDAPHATDSAVAATRNER